MSQPLLALFVIFLFQSGEPVAVSDAVSVQPVRVCTVLQDLTSYTGKVVAVVGRFSYRHDGRFLSEETCESGGSVLPVAFDKKLAPKTPEHLEIGSLAVAKLLKQIQKTTALAKFRFGTPDYDRWAVVYGRVEPGSSRPVVPNKGAQAELICAGDSEVMFIVDRY